ncbi:SDR family NAD(P)-dependent oxidoreductase [Candidatus Uhrbacteria bacterium]|nr:SDR family NAD(P)-dependent oxidoreductase [Candidatus Uhrbacteria bacterium]
MNTVFITGTDKGIGKALCEKFLAEGFFVIGTYFKEPALVHPQFLGIPLNLADARSISSCVSEIKAMGRTIDLLINNAGVLVDEDQTSVEIDRLRKTLDVNLIGTIDFTQQMLAHLASKSHIVNISSTAGSLSLVGKVSHFMGHYPAYKISKAALNMYTRVLALELADTGIIVSSVHPGWVKTDIGGQEATLTPQQAAEGIYAVATMRPESGGFWFAGEPLPW